jgi:hypothetical protein
MLSEDTPFPSGWWGQGLADVRPRISTYGLYPHEALPPLPFRFEGDFEWLRIRPTHENNIAREKPAKNAAALKSLLKDASSKKVVIPPEFTAFFRSVDLQHRVRSCTDCFWMCQPSTFPRR